MHYHVWKPISASVMKPYVNHYDQNLFQNDLVGESLLRILIYYNFIYF